MRSPSPAVSRRSILKTATIAAASMASSAFGAGPSASARAASAVMGPAGFIPTSRIDPRSYLKAGQTWTTVACIRPAFQAALDEAHRRTQSNAAEVVELVIPPGVGRLTTASGRAPVNRSSRTDPKGIYDKRIGFGLLANIQGKILIRGSGGLSRASVIRLSDDARNLFWIDSDTGMDWQPTGTLEPSGAPVERTTKPLMLRNVLFQGFAVDNNRAGGSGHIVCGNVPGFTTPQRYVSVQNVHAIDIDVWGTTQPATAEEQEEVNKSPFVYTGRHFSDYEANGGPGRGRVDGHAWKGWELATVEGRAAAHAAGWTWMHAMTFDRVRATNTNRGIIVIGEAHAAFSHWVDGIDLTNCEHRQDRPYTSGTIQQTSFFIGGSCQGGSASVTACTSVNIGDDSVEIGGMQNARVSRLTSINACLVGVYLRYGQPPLDWRTTRIVVEDSTFTVTGEAITSTQPAYFRAIPIEAYFDADAAPYALAQLVVDRCTTTIDGRDATGRPVGVLDKLGRNQRYGWMLAGPVSKASFNSCVAVLSDVRLTGTNPERYYRMIMWHAQQMLPPALGASPTLNVTDCSVEARRLLTNGGRGDFVGLAVHSAGPTAVTGFQVTLRDNGDLFRTADIGRIGWLLPNTAPCVAPQHAITRVDAAMPGTTATYRKGIAIYDDQPVQASSISNVSCTGWGITNPVNTMHGPQNAENLVVGS